MGRGYKLREGPFDRELGSLRGWVGSDRDCKVLVRRTGPLVTDNEHGPCMAYDCD